MLRDALKRDFSEDAAVLAKAATIIRDDILNHQWFKFTGSFPPGCQEDSLPFSLKSLDSHILNSPNLMDQDKHESQPCLTISQLLYYNIKKKSSDSAVKMRHTLVREPLIPIYIGLNMHQLTRSKKLVQQLYRMGMCISYDRGLKSGLQLQLVNDLSKMELFHLLVFERVCSLLVPLTIWTITPVQLLLYLLFMALEAVSFNYQ